MRTCTPKPRTCLKAVACVNNESQHVTQNTAMPCEGQQATQVVNNVTGQCATQKCLTCQQLLASTPAHRAVSMSPASRACKDLPAWPCHAILPLEGSMAMETWTYTAHA